MYNLGLNGTSSPTLTGVTFSRNSAATNGGAMYNDARSGGTSNPTLTNVTFSRNTTNFAGGAMRNQTGGGGTSSPDLTDVTFFRNSADYGGAMFSYGEDGTSSPILNKVSFSLNSADVDGGAMYNIGATGTSSPILTDVTFSGNSAGNAGGAMFNEGNGGICSPLLNRVVFSNNLALGGAAIYNRAIFDGSSHPSLTNVSFFENTAVSDGGTIYNRGNGYSNFSLTNVTFSANSGNGSVLYNYGDDNSYDLTNVVIWANNGTDIEIGGFTTAFTVSFSLIEGGVGSLWFAVDGGNNLDGDPLFVDQANGNLHLLPNSPALDVGDGTACPAVDLDGFLRPLGSGCDMGAFELWDPHIALSLIPGDGELSWDTPGTGCTYDVFESSSPYTAPVTPAYTGVTSPYPLVGKLGTVGTNYFYIVRANCTEGTLTSNEVGEFDFALMPGAP